ncbi:MAG TPA: ribonuclease E/G, partial [Variovorax sp.]|nr:ribonuclease E/G [Variovorax sp.]
EREPRSGRERSVYAARDPGVAAQSGAVTASTPDASVSQPDEPSAHPTRDPVPSEGRRERRSESDGMRDQRHATPTAGEGRQGTSQVASMAGHEDVGAAQDGGAPGSAPGETLTRREGDERRGRSRDRYGRDRRERAPRDEAPALAEDQAAKVVVHDKDAGERPQRTLADVRETPISGTVPEKEHSPITSSAKPIAAEEQLVSMRNNPATLSEPEVTKDDGNSDAAGVLPRVQPFELPVAALAQIAEGSGLHWVNSNAQRVAQVQAAIAAEPTAIHVPRERAPAVTIDEGPLVLVETKRDLANTVLPFERSARAEDVAAH